MIIEEEPLSISESSAYVDKTEKGDFDLKSFIKKFAELSPEKAAELRKKIIELGIMKLREENISKIIDFLPVDEEELNKILSDVSLNEDETNKVISTVKEYS
jgi:DNA-directed RNA polymerase subunit F